ncbi:MAG TPA: PPOX class F420-dependent oxidoreductase [Dermatophilaceae bacterium]|nr:PPOX class F420-dependent oxidoreductase [Dermatophilaceae bacterium]
MSTEPSARPVTDLAGEKYVRLTTFRRSGEPVPTPVWVVGDGGALLVTTPASSGKVKRLRHTPRVELAQCDQRGRVAEGAPVVAGVSEVLADAATQERLRALMAGKYGLLYRLIRLSEAVSARLGRAGGTRVALRITDPPAGPPVDPPPASSWEPSGEPGGGA